MAENRTTDAVKLNLRLPKSLHRQLVQQAARRNVSVNTEIVEQLQGSRARSYKELQNVLFHVVKDYMEVSPHLELFRERARQEITKEWEVILSQLLKKTVMDCARVAAETTAEILQKENKNLGRLADR